MKFKVLVVNLDDLSDVEFDVDGESDLAKSLRLFAKLTRLSGWTGAMRELRTALAKKISSSATHLDVVATAGCKAATETRS